MSRNRYTRIVHERDAIRLALQTRELRRLAYELRRQPTGALEAPVAAGLPAVIDLKSRRRARLEQKRQFKPGPALAASA